MLVAQILPFRFSTCYVEKRQLIAKHGASSVNFFWGKGTYRVE